MLFIIALCFGIAAAAALIYLPGLPGAFVLDDGRCLEGAAAMPRWLDRKAFWRSWVPVSWLRRPGAYWRVLTFYSYLRDFLIHGRDPAGWRGTNIAIHVVNSVLVLAGLCRFFDWQSAAIGALAFAFHPLASAAVLPISGRASLLCTAFTFAAGLSAMIGGRAWLLVPAFWYLAIMAKEEGIAAPALILGLALVGGL